MREREREKEMIDDFYSVRVSLYSHKTRTRHMPFVLMKPWQETHTDYKVHKSVGVWMLVGCNKLAYYLNNWSDAFTVV